MPITESIVAKTLATSIVFTPLQGPKATEVQPSNRVLQTSWGASVGTGGYSTPLLVAAQLGRAKSVDEPGGESSAFEKQIRLIQSNAGLTVSEIANLLSLSRQSVHAWMRGSTPKSEHLEWLAKLSVLSDRIASLGVAVPKGAVFRNVNGEQSIAQAFVENGDVEEAIDRLHSSLEGELDDARKLGDLLANRKGSDPSLHLF